MDVSRQPYTAWVRVFPWAPPSLIQFYFTPPGRPWFTDDTIFWPTAQFRQWDDTLPNGEILELGRVWHNLYDPIGLPGDHVEGTPEDFAGRGVLSYGHPPTCDDAYISGLTGNAAGALEAGSTWSIAYTFAGTAQAAGEAQGETETGLHFKGVAHGAVEPSGSPLGTTEAEGVAEAAAEASGDPVTSTEAEGVAEAAAQAQTVVTVEDGPPCLCCGGDCLPSRVCLVFETGEEECECLFPGLLCGIEDDCSWKVQLLWNPDLQGWDGTSPAVPDCLPERYYFLYCHTDAIEPGVNWYFTLEQWEGETLVQESTVDANVCGDPVNVEFPDFFGLGGSCGGGFTATLLTDGTCSNPGPEVLCVNGAGFGAAACGDCSALNVDYEVPKGHIDPDDEQYFQLDTLNVCGEGYRYEVVHDFAEDVGFVNLRDGTNNIRAVWQAQPWQPWGVESYDLVFNDMTVCTVPATITTTYGACE